MFTDRSKDNEFRSITLMFSITKSAEEGVYFRIELVKK